VAAKPIGGKRSPLDAHRDRLLALIAEEPDLTLQEIRGRLRARGIIIVVASSYGGSSTAMTSLARQVRQGDCA
jgi:3'-phosphoadenosine 5'-phosphosulfate sulfotransferase (PAPS reductase)/FAD synthetase